MCQTVCNGNSVPVSCSGSLWVRASASHTLLIAAEHLRQAFVPVFAEKDLAKHCDQMAGHWPSYSFIHPISVLNTIAPSGNWGAVNFEAR